MTNLTEAVALALVKALQKIEPNVRVDSLSTEEENSLAKAAIAAMCEYAGQAEVTQEDIHNAALDWCGRKNRESFPDDIEYFKCNWRWASGMEALVNKVANRRHHSTAPLLARIAELEACIDLCIPDDCKSQLHEDATNLVRLQARVNELEATIREQALQYLALDGQATEAMAENARLREVLKHVTDCLVLEMGDHVNEDDIADEDLPDFLGKRYAKQVIAARLRIRQARAALTQQEQSK